MISRVFVINLARCPDRRTRMRERLGSAGFELDRIEFFDAVDGTDLSPAALKERGVSLLPNWKVAGSSVAYWARDLKWGEVACSLSHQGVWRRIAESDATAALVLEDDVVFTEGACRAVEDALEQLARIDPDWDLCYVGRKRLLQRPFVEAPAPAERRIAPRLLVPTFSYCAHAYVLSRTAARNLLAMSFETALIPVDELLPALYAPHPREDVRSVYGTGDRLRAYAIDPNIASQSGEGSTTEDSSIVNAASGDRARAVLRLLQGESIATVAREHDVDEGTLSSWRQAFLLAGERALEPRHAAGPTQAPGLDVLLPNDARGFLERLWPGTSVVQRGPVERLGLPAKLFDIESILGTRGLKLSLFGKKGFRAEIASPEDAVNFYRNGDTIYVVNLDKAFPEFRALCNGLARDLEIDAAHVHVEGFASREGSGSSMHYDFDVNFNVQLKGSKEWKLAPNPDVINPLRSLAVREGVIPMGPFDGCPLPTQMPADAATYRVDPGDVVFLPRGTWHETKVLADSFAIAFVIKPPTYAALFANELGNRLRMDRGWRAYPLGKNRSGALAELMRSVPNILAGMTPEELLFNVVRVRWIEGSKPNLERLTEPRHGESWSLTVLGEDLDLEFPVGNVLAPIVDWMTKRKEVFTTEQLATECAGISPTVARALVSYLIEVGALERVTSVPEVVDYNIRP